MISSRERGLVQLLVAAEIGVITIFYWVAFLAVFGLREIPHPPLQTYAKYSIIMIIAMIFEGITRPSALRFRPGRIRRIAGAVSRRQTFWMMVAVMSLLVFSKDLRISRVFLASFVGGSFVVLYFSNRFAVRWATKLGKRFLRDWRLRTVILGPREWCESILSELNFTSGIMDLRETIHTDDYGSTEEGDRALLQQVSGQSLDLLIMPPRSFSSETVIDLMRLGDRRGFRCWLPVEYTRQYGRRFSMQRVGRLDILTPPVEPLENTSNRVLKRAFDLLFGCVVCVLILPGASLFVWLLHRLYSPGPLFFKQERIGKNGEPFVVYKFRSLSVENGDESRQVTSDDDRIFRGGRFIRKASIDEIPQFINVLRGEMSVVGPRPHLAKHDDEFAVLYESYGHRRYVKPGVTGLAQAKGFRGEVKSPIDLRHRARMDRFYVTHWDLGLDLRIILLTFVSVARPPKTAY